MKKLRIANLLFLICLYVSTFAQSKVTVSGVVKDAHGEAVFAAAVAVKDFNRCLYG